MCSSPTIPRQLAGKHIQTAINTPNFLYGLCHKKEETVGLSLFLYIVVKQCLGKTIPQQQILVGGIISYVVCVVSKASRKLVLSRISKKGMSKFIKQYMTLPNELK
jgi:hypothetical protein